MPQRAMRVRSLAEAEIDRQWKGVVRDYPLIAAAVMVRNRKLARTVADRLQGASLKWVSVLRGTITERVAELVNQPTAMIAEGRRIADCFRRFEIDVGSAQNDSEAMAAGERLSACLRRD